MSSRKVSFVHDDAIVKATSNIPNLKNRSLMVMALIKAYELFGKMDILPSRLATSEELLSFHSNSYLEFLEEHSALPVGSKESDLINETNALNEFGLGYDCPPFENMKAFSEIIAGGTLAAVDNLVSGNCEVGINWCGGWHHAQRDEASGFCYVNDIVIAIHSLQRRFKKILYIDLDVHHGDGVENAFSFSKNVLTLSIHNFEAGYFPGTGGISRNFTINVPLKSGITDKPYVNIFSEIFDMISPKFQAEAIVVQCGADSVAGDTLGTFNLTEFGMGECLKKILACSLPTLILGGGGYNFTNTARCWTYLTAVALGVNLSSEIPDHDYFLKYGPDFERYISPTLRKDENSIEYLSEVVDSIKGNTQNLD